MKNLSWNQLFKIQDSSTVLLSVLPPEKVTLIEALIEVANEAKQETDRRNREADNQVTRS